MALIKCPECGEMVSDKARKCPKCGYSLKKKIKDIKTNKLLLIGGIVCVSIFCLISFLHLQKSSYIIRNIKWGMDIQSVKKAEKKYSGIVGEYNNEFDMYLIENTDEFGRTGNLLYSFNIDGILEGIQFLLEELPILEEQEFVNQLYMLYGVPSEIVDRSNDDTITTILRWEKNNYKVSALFEYEGVTSPVSVCVVYSQEDCENKYTEYARTVCTSGSALPVPCKEAALPWNPEHCMEHGCFVVGCDEYVYTNDMGYGVCTHHAKLFGLW